MIEVDISIPEPSWEETCPDSETIVTRAIEAVIAHSPVAKKLITSGVEPEISVVLANDDLIHTLNREYRDKDNPTNVLSFAMLDGDNGWEAPNHPGPCVLGDLVLAFETVKRESEAESKSFDDHFMHLVIHGMLHLLGYDHIEDREAEVMESIEIQILKDMNIKNPYQND
jgi:probable rRNA maturation factor